jgi:hypothetical protein
MFKAVARKLATALCACVVLLSASAAAFSEGDPVPVVANKVRYESHNAWLLGCFVRFLGAHLVFSARFCVEFRG